MNIAYAEMTSAAPWIDEPVPAHHARRHTLLAEWGPADSPGGSWVHRAACAKHANRDLFFDPDRNELRHALAICAFCPVLAECLLEAWTTEPHDGRLGLATVRGGMRPAARQRFWRRVASRPSVLARQMVAEKAAELHAAGGLGGY